MIQKIVQLSNPFSANSLKYRTALHGVKRESLGGNIFLLTGKEDKINKCVIGLVGSVVTDVV